jgi:flavin reductase (DIM6/NTAB) family NADH-FMN oxidoreductase RutF
MWFVVVVKVECGIEDVFGLAKARLQDCGLLLTSVDLNGKSNVMTIGWGLMGRLWGQMVFMVAVRPSRHTFGLIEETGEFTVNVPPKGDLDGEVAYCGKFSGRDHDKFKESGLEVEKGITVKSPMVSRCVAHFECKVLGKARLVPELLGEDVRKGSYASGNFHTLYFGKPLKILMER